MNNYKEISPHAKSTLAGRSMSLSLTSKFHDFAYVEGTLLFLALLLLLLVMTDPMANRTKQLIWIDRHAWFSYPMLPFPFEHPGSSSNATWLRTPRPPKVMQLPLCPFETLTLTLSGSLSVYLQPDDLSLTMECPVEFHLGSLSIDPGTVLVVAVLSVLLVPFSSSSSLISMLIASSKNVSLCSWMSGMLLFSCRAAGNLSWIFSGDRSRFPRHTGQDLWDSSQRSMHSWWKTW